MSFLPVLLLISLHSIVSAEEFTCEPLSIGLCSDLNYNRTRFPNEMGHSTQRDAANELQAYAEYFDSSCSSDIKLFLCSLYAPYCNGSGIKIQPCRGLCINVRDRCEALIKSHSLSWPNQWRCGRFPIHVDQDQCVQPVEKPLTEPANPLTTHQYDRTEQPPVTEKKITELALPVNHNCRANEFFCDDACYPLMWRCDQYADCKDGSDEKDCDRCLSNQFRCEDGSQCLPLYSRCDTYRDCTDGSDEANCKACSGNEFQCDRDNCIPMAFKCDGRKDCADGTDEKECGECSVGMFKCSNNLCIDAALECDGTNDCGDNSDETSTTCYNVNPDSNTKPEEKEKENNPNDSEGGVAYECATAHRDCNMDTECEKEMLNYRTVCEQQMASDAIITCSKECYNAYYQLRSREPFGKTLIDNKCTEVSVRNVKLSCIRQPASMGCINAIQKCSSSPECRELHQKYSMSCSDTLTQHDACSDQCKINYKTFTESPLSNAIQENCIEVNTTILVRCGGIFLDARSSSASLIISIVTILLTSSLAVILR